MTKQTVFFGLLAAFVSALAYGSNVPYARLSANMGVAGADIVFYRSLAMILLLAALTLVQGDSLKVPREAIGKVIGLGLFTAMVGLTYISSVAFIPVGVATIIFYTFPLIILVASPFIDGERLTFPRVLIFLVAFAGLFVAIGPSFTSLDWRGLALAFIAAFGATGQFFFAARATRAMPPIPVGFWTQLILLPVAATTVFAIGGPAPLATLAAAWWPVFMTCALFVVAFVLHLKAARAAPPAVIGLVYCAEPVTSIIVAAFLLNETLALSQLLGGGLVLLAVIAAVLVERAKPA
jgi:drug/metabolite transporter (DMT)-like permease